MLFFKQKVGSHSRIVQWIMFAFIISLGIGAEASIGPVKISYITLIMLVAGLLKEYTQTFKIEVLRIFSKEITIFLIVWVIYGFVQRFWLTEFDLWQTYYRGLIINAVVIVLLVSYIRCWDDWKWISISFAGMLIMYLAIGAWEIITANHIVHGKDIVKLTEHTPLVFWVNENDAGVMFSLLLINLLMLYWADRRNTDKKTIFAILGIITLVEIYFTNGRGSIIGLLTLIIFGIYFYVLSKVEEKNAKLGKIILISCIAIVAIIITLMLIAHPMVWYVERFSSDKEVSSSDVFRLGLIVDSFNAFVASHLLGVGPGQLIKVNGMPIHFFYLEMLFEYGIFVGGYLLYIFARIAFKFQPNISRPLRSIIRATPIAFIMLGLSTSKMFLMRPMWILFVLIYTCGDVFHKDLQID